MRPDPTHDEIMELLGVYALDAVDPDERGLVERHLPDCPRCKAEVADHREVAAMMAHTGAPAPEGVWTRIAAALEEPAPEMRLDLPIPGSGAPAPHPGGVTSIADAPSRRRTAPRTRALLGAAAAALVAMGVLAGVLVADDDPPTQVAAGVALEDMYRQALDDPAAQKVTLSSVADPDLSASAVVGADGAGYLVATSLPALDETRTYQLWGARDDVVFSLGVLGASPDVVAFHAADGVDALVITEETAGGVAVSAQPALLFGEIS